MIEKSKRNPSFVLFMFSMVFGLAICYFTIGIFYEYYNTGNINYSSRGTTVVGTKAIITYAGALLIGLVATTVSFLELRRLKKLHHIGIVRANIILLLILIGILFYFFVY